MAKALKEAKESRMWLFIMSQRGFFAESPSVDNDGNDGQRCTRVYNSPPLIGHRFATRAGALGLSGIPDNSGDIPRIGRDRMAIGARPGGRPQLELEPLTPRDVALDF